MQSKISSEMNFGNSIRQTIRKKMHSRIIGTLKILFLSKSIKDIGNPSKN